MLYLLILLHIKLQIYINISTASLTKTYLLLVCVNKNIVYLYFRINIIDTHDFKGII
jgi:hypothetical protein